MARVWLWLLLLGFLAGCSGGGSSSSGGGPLTPPTPPPPGVTPVSLEISGIRESLPQGYTQQVQVTLVLSDGTRQNVTPSVQFTVSNSQILEHRGNGLFQALSPGQVRVTAQASGRSASAEIRVTAARLQRLEISPRNVQVPVGVRQPFRATGFFDDGTELDITTQTTWESSNPTLATIGAEGALNTLAPGELEVRARRDGVSATTLVSIAREQLLELQITPNNQTLPVGVSQEYTVVGIYSGQFRFDLTNHVEYEVDGPAQITSSGILTGNQVGQVVLTARFAGRSASTSVNISSAALQRIDIQPGETTVSGLKRYVQFTARGRYSDASTRDLTAAAVWSSDSPSIATVSNAAGSTGTATSQSFGAAAIRASFQGVQGTAQLNVTEPGVNEWTYRIGRPPLSAVVQGNGRYVAVGDQGVVRTSLDGSDWVPQSTPTRADLYGVIFDGQRFLAVGSQGTTATSSDGLTWTVRLITNNQYHFADVALSGGLFVTVGSQGSILTSSDGNAWVRQNSPTTELLLALTHGPAGWVAVGDNGTTLHSGDGAAWTTTVSGTRVQLNDVTFAGGKYVAVGNGGVILTSIDGQNWVRRTTALDPTAELRAVEWTGERFVTLGYDLTPNQAQPLAVSADGISWTVVPQADGHSWTDLIAFRQGVLVVGRGGEIETSDDLGNWETRAPLDTFTLEDVTYGAGKFVAVRSSGVLVSSDAIRWEKRDANSPLPLSAITYGNGRFVAAGPSSGLFVTSTDAQTWTQNSNPFVNGVNALTYAGGQFVAVGTFGAATSADGLNWTPRSTASSAQSVTYGNGLYIAAGGRLQRSPDGITWTAVAGVPLNFSCVTFGEGKFAAVNENGTVYVSTNGVNWTPHAANPVVAGQPVLVESIAYGDGKFVLAGWFGVLMESDDAQTWTYVQHSGRANYRAVAFLRDLWIAVGEWGTVYTSP